MVHLADSNCNLNLSFANQVFLFYTYVTNVIGLYDICEEATLKVEKQCLCTRQKYSFRDKFDISTVLYAKSLTVTYICMYVRVYVCMYVYVYMYLCMHITYSIPILTLLTMCPLSPMKTLMYPIVLLT